MKTILLVDDSHTLLGALTRALSAKGYHVLAASDCEDAIRAASDAHVDAAIVDFILPAVDGRPCDGVHLLGHLRALFPGLPVALLSGFLPPDERMLNAGFTEIRWKPIPLDDVVALARCLTLDA
jgi:DNA-binding response OmpR family regulator